jgi:thiol-disulfide isomerase/thioredoxin
MRRISFCLLIGLLLGCSDSGGLRLLDGGKVDIQRQEPLLFVNYWAVWCAPCLIEMPELHKFAQDHQGQVRVLGVNYDNPDAETLRADAERLNVQIELLLDDPQPLLNYERPEVLPTTFVLRGGEVLETLVGPQTLDSLEERLAWWTNN